MTISEPFQLYLGSKHSQKIENHQKGISLEALYTSYNPDLPGYATVTAQADGVHIWDLRNLHPVASYSVGEHVAFSGPAFSIDVDGDKSITSYVGVQSEPGTKLVQGCAVWIIRHDLSGPGATTQKTVAVVPELPVRICGTGHNTVPLLMVTQNGSISIANAQAHVQSSLEWPGKRKHLETFVFPRKSCSFVQDDMNSYSSVAVICCQIYASLQVQLVLLGDTIVPVGSCSTQSAGSHHEIDLLAVTCSSSGVLSFVDSLGRWSTYQLNQLELSQPSSVSESLHLQRFSFLSADERDNVSTVSLGTSIALLAAQIDETRDLSLQIWDLSYGVLLAEQPMPVPYSVPHPSLKLIFTSEGQALLTVSSSRTHHNQRPSIFVVPIDTELKSTLAAALGKTDLTAKWLFPRTKSGSDEESKIIKRIRKALQNKNAANAEKAFLEWVESHSSRETVMRYDFVKNILDLALSPEFATKGSYAPRIVRCVLENGAVSAIMLNGRLITMLSQQGDWENVMFALTMIMDISEDELMAGAKSLIDSHRKRENAMDVTASKDYLPPLWSYLSACVSYPSSPALTRLAIRKHLSDAQDLVEVLEILGNWMHTGNRHEVEALLTSLATNTKVPSSSVDFPPYPKVLAFLQALFDASFVALLQYQPSHDLLHRILSYIEPEISFIDHMEPLRGMLEPFVKTRSLNEKQGVFNENPAEWRRRRKQFEQQALDVGLYRLEELAI